jgi:D-alanyl-D-alanine carboxypeptidase
MEEKEPKVGSNVLLLGILLLILIAINAFVVFDYPTKSSEQATDSQKPPIADTINSLQFAYILPLSEPSYIPILDTSVPRPTINAKSAIVYNLRSGRFLFEQDTKARLPIASLTKIMSAVVVIEKMDLSAPVKIEKNSIRVDGQRQELYEGEEISVGNLLKMMLIESSNDAAYALANYAQSNQFDFLAEMNKKAEALKMNNTKFIDPAGLDDNAYSTAEDLARLAKYALKYKVIWDVLSEKDTIVKSLDEKIQHVTRNTNILLETIPDIIGGKTGYTDNALGCLILVVNIPDKNDSIVSVVLGSNDRFGDTERLVSWIKKAYRWD